MATPRCYLVVWTYQIEGVTHTPSKFQIGSDVTKILHDQWMAFDSYIEARRMYRKLIRRDDIYSASVCIPVDSTDY